MQLFSGLYHYLVLPSEISTFEATYLQRMNRVGYAFFFAHIPVFTAIAWFNGTGPLFACALTLFIVAGPILAPRLLRNPRHVSITFGVAAMSLGGLLVHLGQGPMQIEMHFYFFVLIALLAVFANPAVILAAALTVTLHHAALWLLLPSSVFNYEASVWTVVVHALFVALESVAACFVARSFFDDVIGLERIVLARTEEIDARNRELRLIFDTVGQGFVTMDREGRMSDERSAIIGRWLGPSTVGERFAEVLRRADEDVALRFEQGWQALIDDVLPLELNLAQLPAEIVCGDRWLSISYTPILQGEHLERVLVVLTDTTAERRRAEAEADQRELLCILDRVQRDRAGLVEFLNEGEALLATLRSSRGDRPLTKRLIHTLKGNAGLFGMSRVADRCHELEEHLSDSSEPLSADAVEGLVHQWDALRKRLGGLLGEGSPRVELDDAEYGEALEAVVSGRPSDELAELIRSWRHEPMRRRLARIGEQAQAVAQRLGREPLQVQIEDGGVRLEASEWLPFWSAFVHVVRNAVDHGIEPAAERIGVGKPPHGRVTLATAVDGDALLLSITDDGRGIDWAGVERRARQLGLAANNEVDLQNALLRDGVTTRDDVGAFSGRGVGMGAIAAACRERGGEMTMESVPGAGTTVHFRFPGVFESRRAA